MSISEKLVKRDGQIITRRGFDFRYGDYLISWLPMVEQLGGKLVSDDGKKAIINDKAWIKALQYMADFGPNGKNLGSPTYTAARKVFDNDKNEIAMHLSGLYQEQRMNAANEAFFKSSDWMVVPYPTWKGVKNGLPNHYYGHYYMVSSQISKEKQAAAWKLVAFMLGHGEEYLTKTALVQPSKTLFDSATFKNMPYSAVFKADLQKGEHRVLRRELAPHQQSREGRGRVGHAPEDSARESRRHPPRESAAGARRRIIPDLRRKPRATE